MMNKKRYDSISTRKCYDAIESMKNGQNSNFFVIAIDVNGLKEVNDKFGHPAGDKFIATVSSVISEVSSVISEDVRATDYKFRMGGDEFLMIIDSSNINKNINKKDVDRIVEKIKSDLAIKNITISVGVSSFSEVAKTYYDMFLHGFTERDIASNTAERMRELADARSYSEKGHFYNERANNTTDAIQKQIYNNKAKNDLKAAENMFEKLGVEN